MIKAILFDADNTIYRTKDVAKHADMAAMRLFAHEVNRSPKDVYTLFLEIVTKVKQSNDPKKRTRRHSYELLASQLEIDHVEAAHSMFVHTLIDSLKLVEGVLDFLSQVRGKKLAVITEDSKEIAMAKLQKFGLGRLFSTIITSDDVGTMKPSLKYFQIAIKELGVKPKECLVIGDDYNKDLIDAKKQGATVALFGSINSNADFCFMRYSVLEKELKKSE